MHRGFPCLQRLLSGADEGTPLAERCSLTGRGGNHILPRDRPALVGLVAERERLEGLGLSQEVVRTIQGARADSTRACYSAKWAAFQKWCTERGCDPISCPLLRVLSFLCFLKGVRRERPVTRSLTPQWDLTLVLCALVKVAFEPLDWVPLKFVSAKTALLLALTSA